MIVDIKQLFFVTTSGHKVYVMCFVCNFYEKITILIAIYKFCLLLNLHERHLQKEYYVHSFAFATFDTVSIFK